jgi:hypothetical protein
MLRRSCLRVLGVCAALLGCEASGFADGAPTFETYATAEYSGRAAGVASSTVWSAFGPLDQPGFRFKIDGYANIYGESNASVFSSAFLAADVKMLTDVMAGYQLQWDRYWIKFYGGAALQTQTRIFWEAGRMFSYENYGAVAAIETYWRGRGRFWASANVSWLQLDNTVSFYERVAYEAIRFEEGLQVSCGTEIGAIMKRETVYRTGARLYADDNFVKGGALLNFRFWSQELTVSGGLEKATDEGLWRPYATLSYGRKF